MTGKGDGIVIGMSAFVGVCQDDLRLKLFQQVENSSRQVFQFERDSLVGEVEVRDGVAGNTS